MVEQIKAMITFQNITNRSTTTSSPLPYFQYFDVYFDVDLCLKTICKLIYHSFFNIDVNYKFILKYLPLIKVHVLNVYHHLKKLMRSCLRIGSIPTK